MKTDVEKPIDKSKWGRGPWQDEPDRVEFEAEGFPCLIVRHPTSGHLCGYVAVPPGHPWHGKSESGSYDDDGNRTDDGLSIDVHGGITYASGCDGHICHVPKPGSPDNVWWIGFDMAHSEDLSPCVLKYSSATRDVYRTVAYVRRECESVAAQAKAALS